MWPFVRRIGFRGLVENHAKNARAGNRLLIGNREKRVQLFGAEKRVFTDKKIVRFHCKLWMMKLEIHIFTKAKFFLGKKKTGRSYDNERVERVDEGSFIGIESSIIFHKYVPISAVF